MTDDESESAQWRRVCEGDAIARQEFAARHLPIVRRFLANKVDREASQDITHQTFERLFGGVLAGYQGRSRLSSFVLGVAYQCLREFIRTRAKSGDPIDPSAVSLAALCPTPSQVVAQNERHERLSSALRDLPSEHQTILELHYWDQQTTSEIAEIMAIPVGTVRSRLDRARELLRRRLDETHFDP